MPAFLKCARRVLAALILLPAVARARDQQHRRRSHRARQSPDSGGRFSIVERRRGIYTVTFTLPGFTTVKREDIEITANFTGNVTVRMGVGSVEDTVTVAVTIVGVQNVVNSSRSCPT